MAKGSNMQDFAQVIASGPQNGPPNDVTLQLQRLLLEKLMKEKLAEEEEVAAAQRMRESQIPAYQEAEKQRQAQQDGCSHYKEGTTKTALGGQRDHKQTVHYICQICQKEWDSIKNPPPQHLRPDPNIIGGPLA